MIRWPHTGKRVCVYLQVVHQQFIESRVGIKVDKKALIVSNFNP